MALSNAELIDALSAKPIMEIVELVKAMEEKLGVSAAAPVAVAAGPAAAGGAAAPVEEQTEFNVAHGVLRREQGRRHQGGPRRSRASA